MEMASSIIMLVLIFVVFYFLLIRPENKKKKQIETMRSSLKVGDNVTTIGGIIGQIVHIKDDKIVLETSADRVRIEFARWPLKEPSISSCVYSVGPLKQDFSALFTRYLILPSLAISFMLASI